MTDEQLDDLIGAARERYRIPPAPDLEGMWRGIEGRRAAIRHAPSTRGVPRRRLALGAALAAALVLSFSLGRWSAPLPANTLAPAIAQGPAAPTASPVAPVTSVTSELLGQTAELLTALPVNDASPASDRRFAQQAGELLATTRLLLDSRGGDADPALRQLLEDLELILAQVARLRAAETRTERELITEALQQQDLVPRIRTIAAGLSTGAD